MDIEDDKLGQQKEPLPSADNEDDYPQESDAEPSHKPAPKRATIIKFIKANPSGIEKNDRDLDAANSQAEAVKVEVEGRRQFFKLRTTWSWAIIVWITLFLAFHIGLTISIGLSALDFEKFKWFVPMIVVENFLQVIGMGYIIVKFLYTDGKK